jgi:hypothetical protein
MHRFALLEDTMRSYFYVSSISVGPKKTQKYQSMDGRCQEWVNPSLKRTMGEYIYRIKVGIVI